MKIFYLISFVIVMLFSTTAYSQTSREKFAVIFENPNDPNDFVSKLAKSFTPLNTQFKDYDIELQDQQGDWEFWKNSFKKKSEKNRIQRSLGDFVFKFSFGKSLFNNPDMKKISLEFLNINKGDTNFTPIVKVDIHLRNLDSLLPILEDHMLYVLTGSPVKHSLFLFENKDLVNGNCESYEGAFICFSLNPELHKNFFILSDENKRDNQIFCNKTNSTTILFRCVKQTGGSHKDLFKMKWENERAEQIKTMVNTYSKVIKDFLYAN